MSMIVGLGNPGREYLDTRHNAGFMVVDQYAKDLGLSFHSEKRWHTEITRDGDLYLLKPQTFMNESGSAVGKVAAFYKIKPAQILVLYDDMDLPLGRLRIRQGGSAGGHNGMRSVINHLGTQDFPRLRVGIGTGGTGGNGTIKHVLGKFRDEERSELEKSVKKAVLALTVIMEQGLPVAMTRFNTLAETKTKQKTQPGKPSNVQDSLSETDLPAEDRKTHNK
ncbi:MAG: aminoacyl-tRNA hydrolase [Verrucomicrobiaceae bacterium]|nr:aminoacyl-tRNA hydrolase [Verrucomicrobiaceae bacterium]